MKIQDKGRIEWIDALKGIGIISVVAGHVFHGPISTTAYLFHMPLFFFLSGLLFRPNGDISGFIIKGVRRLLVPYVCFLVLLSIPWVLRYVLTKDFSGMKDFGLNAVFGGPMLKGWFSASWFVTCFFIAQQLINLIIVRLGKKLQVVIVLVFLLLAYTNAHFAASLQFPEAANIALMAIPMIYVGYLTKEWSGHRFAVAASVIFVLVCLAIFPEAVLDFDMKYTIYGIPLVSFVVSFACFIALRQVAVFVPWIPFLGKHIESMGRVSLGIMFLHQMLQMQMQSKLHIDSEAARFMLAVLLSYGISILMEKYEITNRLFLGNIASIGLKNKAFSKIKAES